MIAIMICCAVLCYDMLCYMAMFVVLLVTVAPLFVRLVFFFQSMGKETIASPLHFVIIARGAAFILLLSIGQWIPKTKPCHLSSSAGIFSPLNNLFTTGCPCFFACMHGSVPLYLEATEEKPAECAKRLDNQPVYQTHTLRSP